MISKTTASPSSDTDQDGPLEEALVKFKENPDPYGAVSLIKDCTNRKNLDLAFDVYKILIQQSSPNQFVFGSLFNACLKCDGNPSRALDILYDMDRYSISLH